MNRSLRILVNGCCSGSWSFSGGRYSSALMSSQIQPRATPSPPPPPGLASGKPPMKVSSTGGGGFQGEGGQPKSAGARTRIFVLSAIVGASVGGLYGYYKSAQESKKQEILRQIGNKAESNIKPFLLKEKPPYFKPARKIVNPTDTTGMKLTLYQYATCPFCCKARAFLDFMGVSYDVVEVNSVLRKQVKWSTYKKVPIVVAELKTGEVLQLNDSTMIISSLFSYLNDPTKPLTKYVSCYPQIEFIDDDGKKKIDMTNKYFLMYNEEDVSKRKQEVAQERKWRRWVDDVFVHTLSPNIYRTLAEALQAFNSFDKTGEWENHFSTIERWVVIYIGSIAMWGIAKNLKKKYALKDDVRLSLYDETNNWLKAIKAKGTPFMGGDVPNLADLAVYGALSAIEGCEAFLDLCANTKVKPWYDGVKEAIEMRKGQVIKN